MWTLLSWLQQLAGLLIFIVGAIGCLFSIIGLFSFSAEAEFTNAFICLGVLIPSWIVVKLGWIVFNEAD